jgi:glycosyltransferase involved in cell wall biosynthesis
MIKVLRITNRFNLGGPTYNVTFLTRFMSEEFETQLWGGAIGEDEGEALFIPEKYGVQPQIIPAMQREINLKNDRAALKKIREIIREFQPDIVHTHASKAGALGRKAAIKEKVPVIVHTFHGHVFHHYFNSLKTAVYKKVERNLAKKTDAIIAISPIQKRELVETHQIAPDAKVNVIPLGFDLSIFRENSVENRFKFRKKYEIGDDEIALGLIGRMVPIKNHLGFLDAIEVLASKTKQNLVIVLVGDGELREEIEKRSNELVEKYGTLRFVFTSWVQKVNEILPGLDIVCLSSLNEGTPVSLIEAQAAGVPVVTTDVGGVRDVVLDQETGIVTGMFQPNEFAKSLLLLIQNEEIRGKMSQNGWNHVKEKFHYKRLCADMEQLYKSLLAKKQKK